MNKKRENLIQIIQDNVKYYNGINYMGDQTECPHYTFYDIDKLVDAIINSRLLCNGPDVMDEQESHVYRWTAVEDDGYTHSESGVANNMFDAFIKATEYSPSYHKKIMIEKISDEELTKEEKEFFGDDELAGIVADRLIENKSIKDNKVYKPIVEKDPMTHANNHWCSACKGYIGSGISGLIARYCPKCGVKIKE